MQGNYSVAYVHVNVPLHSLRPPAVKHLVLQQKLLAMLKAFNSDISMSRLL